MMAESWPRADSRGPPAKQAFWSSVIDSEFSFLWETLERWVTKERNYYSFEILAIMLFTPRKCWNLLKYKINEKWTSSCSLWTQRLQTQVEKKVGERIRGCQPLYLCWPFFRWKSKYKRVDSSSSSLLLEAGGIRKALVFICVAFPSAALGRSPPPILPRPFPTRVLLLSISLSLSFSPLCTHRGLHPLFVM